MQHIGIDIIEISRIEQAIRHWGDRFLQRVYTNREINLYRKKAASLAARFAAKEAVMKALDTGDKGIGFRDIEIISGPNGKPVVKLHGPAKRLATELGIVNLAVSLSHSRDNAAAVAIALNDQINTDYPQHSLLKKKSGIPSGGGFGGVPRP